MVAEPSLTQDILLTMQSVLTGTGIGGLLAAAHYAWRGRPYKPNRQPNALALIGGSLVVIGFVFGRLIADFTKPVVLERVVSPQRYDSPFDPALTVDAPPGWRIMYDEAKTQLVLTNATDASGEFATLLLRTQTSNESVNVRAMAEGMNAHVAADGPRQTFDCTRGTQPCHGVVLQKDGKQAAIQFVQLAPKRVASVSCVVVGDGFARTACDQAIGQVRWR